MFCHPAILQIFIAASSFVLNHKELEIAQTVQINQLFQLLNLICVYGDVFYGLTRMLVKKKFKQRQRRFTWIPFEGIGMVRQDEPL